MWPEITNITQIQENLILVWDPSRRYLGTGNHKNKPIFTLLLIIGKIRRTYCIVQSSSPSCLRHFQKFWALKKASDHHRKKPGSCPTLVKWQNTKDLLHSSFPTWNSWTLAVFCSKMAEYSWASALSTPSSSLHTNEPVFLNVYGAQESIPRHQFRQPM